MKQKLLFGTLLSSAMMATVSVPTFAQDSSADEIVVTGSRVVRHDLESVSPITITSSEDIKLSGFTKIEDLMNSLPQIEAAQTSFISNGSSGTASLDLRGMGTNRTLVLMNGRRLQPGGIYSQAPDINQIPSALVDRAEVVTGGASSVYGADAVAGVVNYILKDDFEGLEMTAGVSFFQHKNDNDYIQGLMDNRGFEYPDGSEIDGLTYNLDLAIGGNFGGDKGHATVYATWQEDKEVRQEARDYSSCALNAGGTACGGSGNAVVPNFYLSRTAYDGDGNPVFDWGNYDYLTLGSNGEGFIPSVGNAYNYAPINHFRRPDERYTLGAMVDYEINDHINPYMEVSFMRDQTKAQIAESGTFFAEPYFLDINSPLISDTQRQQLISAFDIDPVDGTFATYIGKRNVEGGPRRDSLEHNSFRIVTGTKGEINDKFDYDVSFQYGTTSSSSAYENDFFAPRIATAVDSDACAATAGCIPYEVFTYQGVTSEAAGALTGTGILNGVTEETVLNGYITGPIGDWLGAGEASMVLGGEYREETYQRTADTVFSEGLLLGQGGATPSLEGHYRVSEVFGELIVPVFADRAFGDMELELGGRLSDYTTSGTAETYKIGGTWDINDMIKLRGSYNRAVRAPNVGELFTSQNKGLWGGVDPCANLESNGGQPLYTFEQCARTGVTAGQYGNISESPASQYNALYGGNPNLDVEKADTYSIGTVVRPLSNLIFSVDYWNIEVKDVISGPNAETLLEDCALNSDAAACALINRGNGGSLWLGNSTTDGLVELVASNFATLKYQGVDLKADYEVDALGGEWSADLNGTYFIKKYSSVSNTDCAGVISGNCYPQPEWRHKASINYTPDDSIWSVTGLWRYYGGVDYPDTTDQLLVEDGGIDAQSYFDLKASIDVLDNTSFLFGVNNVLDKEPPLMGGSLSNNANTTAGFYDTLGRMFHASITINY